MVIQDERPAITGMAHDDLLRLCEQAGVKVRHVDTLKAWVFRRGERDISRMVELPQHFQQWLSEHVSWPELSVNRWQQDDDGTQKMLLGLPLGGEVESVLIPTAGRVTQCISSQVGCAMGCTFCLTATAGLQRNLHTSEMVAQLMQARTVLGSYPRNVVLMGMGEPLHNYDAVARFVRIATDPAGMALSPRHVTLSTSGLVPAIERMTAEMLPCNLAVSLNASNDTVRDRIMPVNRKYPLASLLSALRAFATAGTSRKRVLIEYVLMEGVNDSRADAEALVDLLHGLPCTVNLLPL
ncbi:MAG: 23S rRNA (adenine(2503)-C(2))-methyltransferase RlmN, partial [Mariprofundaceae bacterium]|nr:23S rRNA (adenine(2503)-C(2))-methyltransferase RlmN [Mariprofundaceae bacterium]